MIRPVFPAVILFRHGQTCDNASRRFQGHAPTPLNELGRDQARRAGEIVANLLSSLLKAGSFIGECKTSDLLRAKETAGIIAEVIGSRLAQRLNFEDTACLREFCVGDLQGLTVDEFDAANPAVLQRFYDTYHVDPYDTRYPGESGESRRMVAARVAKLVQGGNNRWLRARDAGKTQTPFAGAGDVASHPGEILLWSAHGGTIDVILELMQVEGLGHKNLVGNGDVMFLAPVVETDATSLRTSVRETFALANGCVLKWKMLRHYQVGDNIAARLSRK
jgi:broad specificity phosphatase PhoE